MAEFEDIKEKNVGIGEPIAFENKTDSSFDVGMGVIFHKSGIYEVSLVGNKTIVSKVGKPKIWPESAKEYCAECDHIEMCQWYPYEGCEFRSLPSAQPERKWETCFDCPLSHGCPKINGCTNEQAIEYASQIPTDCPLSVQPEVAKDTNVPTNDCISRQAAIDALDCINGTEEVLRSLPSAEPDLSEYSDKLWRSAYERGKRDAQAELPIKKKCTVCPHCDNCDVNDDGTITQPQPKTGKWIDYTEDGFVECPYCRSATNCESNKDELHYCFSCGAELRWLNG